MGGGYRYHELHLSVKRLEMCGPARLRMLKQGLEVAVLEASLSNTGACELGRFDYIAKFLMLLSFGSESSSRNLCV